MWLGTAMLLPFAPGLPHAVATAPAGAIAAVLYLGVGASALGFVSWAYASARVPVSFAASTLYAIPVVAALVAWAWLGETPAALAVAGGAVAIAGVALTARAAHRPSPARPASCWWAVLDWRLRAHLLPSQPPRGQLPDLLAPERRRGHAAACPRGAPSRAR